MPAWLLVGVLALTLAAPTAALAQKSDHPALGGADLLAALHAGGLVLYFRHADTDSGSPGRYEALRVLLSTPVAPGTNLVLVGHAYPYYSLVGGQYLEEGEADVARPRGADFEVVARVGLKQWRELAAAPPSR